MPIQAFVKACDVCLAEAGVAGLGARGGQGGIKAFGMGQIAGVHGARAVDLDQQAVEQRHIRAGRDGQMHLGPVTAGGAARVDIDDDPRALEALTR